MSRAADVISFRAGAILGIVMLTILASGEEAQDSPVKIPQGCRVSEGGLAERYTGTNWAKEVIHEKTGIDLVFVPAGEFMMGPVLPEDEAESGKGLPTIKELYPAEHPRHSVSIATPFYLGKYEVTNQQYRAFIDDSGYEGAPEGGASYLAHLEGDSSMPTEGTCPVIFVSWRNAQAFCRWAGLALPSEAEWEYACRAGIETPLWEGEDLGPFSEKAWERLSGYAWFKGNARGSPHPVGERAPNAWGLYDTMGNVWEWCEDRWHKNYEGAPEDQAPWTQGGITGRRVLRGGSWKDYPFHCDAYVRCMGNAEEATHNVGFRVALPLP